MRIKYKEFDWIKEAMKLSVKTIGTVAVLVFSAIFQNIYLIPLALLLNIKPVINTPKYKKQFRLSTKKSTIYASHLILSAYPITLGVFRYFIGKLLGMPLTNKRLMKRK
jgi:hypothetical protein